MRKVGLSIFLILLIIHNTSSQNYLKGDKLFIEGVSLFKLYQFNIAIKKFLLASEYYIYAGEERKEYLGITYRLIGFSYYHLSHYDKAIQYYNKALDIFNEFDFEYQCAIVLNDIGLVHFSICKYNEAIDYYKKALNIMNRFEEDVYLAKIINNLGQVYDALGKYEFAMEKYKLALDIANKHTDKYIVAVIMNNMALLFNTWGQYDKAIEYYKIVIPILEEYGDIDSLSTCLNNIGYAYQSKSLNNIALEYYQKALDIAVKNEQKMNIARCLNNIGLLYIVWGEYDKAIENFQKALEISREIGRKNTIATTLNNIGQVYQAWGNYNKAIEYSFKALAINEEIPDKEGIISSLINIGSIYINLKQYNKALERFDKALKLSKENNHIKYIINCLVSIGQAYLFNSNFNLAIKYYKDALSYLEKYKLKREAISILYTIVAISYFTEQFDKILNYNKKILQYSEELQDQNLIAIGLTTIGMTYNYLELYDIAIEYLKKSIAIREELRLTASDELRRDYLASQIDTYRQLITTYIKIHKYFKALETIEQSKARYLSEKLGESLNINNAKINIDQKFQKNLNSNEAILLFINISMNQTVLILISKNEILGIELDKKSFIDKVKRKCEKWMKLKLATLPDDSILIEYKNNFNFINISQNNQNNDFENIITFYHHLLTIKDINQIDREYRDFIGQELYNLFILPIVDKLSQKKEITIIPDGILNFLSFETFMTKENEYLIEDYDIKYSQSLTVLEMIKRRKYKKGRKTFIGFGGAIYNPSTYEKDMIVTDKQIQNSLIRGENDLSLIFKNLGLSWRNLKGSFDEVKSIEKLFKKSVIYTGKYVNEEFIKQLSKNNKLTQYEIIHFSTHALVIPNYPELSSIVLSQTSNNDHEDGYLRMKEIYELHLNAEFVNLSACRTGLGKLYEGEGVVGLTQAFLLAGANGLSVSLWQVDDISTKEFMIGFYNLVNDGFDYKQAISIMKRTFLKTKYNNPYYWAPFVYYGK